jgi:MoaA/NifB/PqqE/SkfB family radical SAM enzyme
MFHPDFIQFEPNTACNLACPICPSAAGLPGRAPHRVRFEEYREIFQAAFSPPYLIVYSGFSEALLNPDLARMAAFEKARGCRVFVASNATLLEPESVSGLLDCGVDQFVISLDTLDPDRFSALRAGTSFEAVSARVLWLREEIARRGADSRIVINAVVTRSTAGGLPDLLEFLHRHGLCDLALIKVMRMAGMDDPFLDAEFLDWPAYRALPFERLAQHAEGLGIRLMRSDDRVLHNQGCHLPLGGLYISAEFDVSVCPFLSFSAAGVFGNLRQTSIDEIRGSDRFTAFADRFRRGGWLEACEDCACLFS